MSKHLLDDINQLVQKLWEIDAQTGKNRCIENLTQAICAKIWNKEPVPEQPYYGRDHPLRGWQEALFEIRRQERRALKEKAIASKLEIAIRACLRQIIPRVSSIFNWGDDGNYFYYWFKIPGQESFMDLSFSRKEGVLYWDLYLPKSLLSSLAGQYTKGGYKRERNTLYKPIKIGDEFDNLT